MFEEAAVITAQKLTIAEAPNFRIMAQAHRDLLEADVRIVTD